MRLGQTPRVERLLKAYRLVYCCEPSTPDARTAALRRRIAAVLPQLTRDETYAYYRGVRQLTEAASLRVDRTA
jgi:hypothetical protein